MVKGDHFWIVMHYLIINTYLTLNLEYIYRYGFSLDFVCFFITSMLCCLFLPLFELRWGYINEPMLPGWGGFYFSHVLGFICLIPLLVYFPRNEHIIFISIYIGGVFLFWVLMVVFLPIVAFIFLEDESLYQPLV